MMDSQPPVPPVNAEGPHISGAAGVDADNSPVADDATDGRVPDSSLALATLRHIVSATTYGFGVFITTHLMTDVVIGLPLAGLCFWIAYDGSILRGTLAAIVGLILAVILGFLLAAHLAVSLTLIRTVRRTQLGSLMLQTLLDRLRIAELSGVQRMDGLTAEELREKLHTAAADYLAEAAPERKPLQWLVALAARTQRIAIWATVRVIVAFSTDPKDPNARIRIAAIQERLGDRIDRSVVDDCRRGAFRFAFVAISLFAILAVMGAYGIGRIPT